ncbi:hypothetical protein EDF66_107137 [Sphingobacterium sp. JUb20]|nr:hypothetical protein [Sphingobacterium sp. JUb21]TCR05241.1 hypothetical protein EDF66_107137 [Sphingobacterium sp. JUb20]
MIKIHSRLILNKNDLPRKKNNQNLFNSIYFQILMTEIIDMFKT